MSGASISRRALLRGGLAMAASMPFTGRAFAQPLSPPADARLLYVTPTRENMRHPTLASNSTDPVAVQLILALDSSGSMDLEEYNIQRNAHANAFIPRLGTDADTGRELNGLIEAAIRFKGGDRSIAVCVIDFSNMCWVRIPWVDFRGDDPDLERKMMLFAAEIASLSRAHAGNTNTNAAMQESHKFLEWCPWKATERKVIDICTDGQPTYGWEDIRRNRDLHNANGVTINALAVINEEPGLPYTLNNTIVTPQSMQGPDGIWSEPGRIWTVAKNMQDSGNSYAVMADFGKEVEYAIKMKISVETAGLEGTHNIMRLAGLKDTRRMLPPLRQVRTAALNYR